jgi:hypothetical protein
MSPLSIIQYIVEHLRDTFYEPWVNILLFMLFFAVIYRAISLLIGRSGRKFVVDTAVAATQRLKVRRGFAPEWERVRIRIEPYVELVDSIYFALLGLCSAVLVAFAMVISRNKVSLWAYCIGVIWVLASFFYMRINLEAASWAYHRIKHKEC